MTSKRKGLQITHNSFEIYAGSFPEAITKTSIKKTPTKSVQNRSRSKMNQNCFPRNLLTEQIFEDIFGSFFEAVSRRPPDPPNHYKFKKKQDNCATCFRALLHLLQHTFRLAGKLSGESLESFPPWKCSHKVLGGVVWG